MYKAESDPDVKERLPMVLESIKRQPPCTIILSLAWRFQEEDMEYRFQRRCSCKLYRTYLPGHCLFPRMPMYNILNLSVDRQKRMRLKFASYLLHPSF